MQGSNFQIEAGNLAFSVTLFVLGSTICLGLLQYRRFSSINAELGGPFGTKSISALIFFFIWISYIVLSALEAYCIIPNF